MASTGITTAGSYTYTVTVAGTHIIEVWGAGGAGGGMLSNKDGAGGGGGGAYARCSVYLPSGTGITLCVGAGGTGVAASTGNIGECSWAITNTCIMALGGGGGQPSPGDVEGPGGAGGLASGSIGDVKFDGGYAENGVASNNGIGGWGGSSAGSGTTGYDTTNQTWTTEVYPTASTPLGAGHGGDGGNLNADGLSPVSGNGGGGGGAGECNVSPGSTGGAGADGMICVTEPTPSSSFIPTIEWI